MVKDETHDRLTSTVSFWSSIGFYSLCSSSMLLVNKMVLARLPYASTLSLIQICAAVVFIQAGSYGNVLKDVDPLEKHKVGPYLFYVFLFLLSQVAGLTGLISSWYSDGVNWGAVTFGCYVIFWIALLLACRCYYIRRVRRFESSQLQIHLDQPPKPAASSNQEVAAAARPAAPLAAPSMGSTRDHLREEAPGDVRSASDVV